MPWKVPLFSRTGELEWFDAGPVTAKLKKDVAGDAVDLERVRRDEAIARYEEQANNAPWEYREYYGSKA